MATGWAKDGAVQEQIDVADVGLDKGLLDPQVQVVDERLHLLADARRDPTRAGREREQAQLGFGATERQRGRLIVESEALTLHSMMMTSIPYFILMKPNTLEIINAIWKYRNETKIPVCFTLDAGANDFIAKPFQPAELTARLKRMIRIPA